MTNAARLALITGFLGQSSHEKSAAVDKEAMTLLARGLGGLVRFGGKALGGGLRALGNSGRVARSATGALTRTPLAARQMAGAADVYGSRGFAPAMRSMGRSIQRGTTNVANGMQGWAANRTAQAANFKPTGNYGFGFRKLNNAVDRFTQNNRPLRGMAGFARMTGALPTSFGNMARSGLLFGYASDRFNHAQRLQDAGNYGAARAIHELRQNPFSQGLPAIFGTSNMVADGLRDAGYGNTGDYLRHMAQNPANAKQDYRNILTGAFLPWYSKAIQ